MPGIAIVTDSAACLPPALAQEYGIYIVPYELVWDGETYLDGQDITPQEFYRLFRTRPTYPTTASPTIGRFVEAFQRAAQEAEGIVAILVPESLTSTVRVARQAAEMIPIPLRIIDAQTAATAEGFIALEAARAARRGASLEEVAAVAEACRKRVGLCFTLETLEHLRRGGRIGRAATLLGARLNVQPIVTLAQGQVQPVAITRNRQRALEMIIAQVHRAVGDRPIRAAVAHADALEDAMILSERVQREFHCVEFFISEFTPVMGAHTGPGVVGVCYCLV
ncbi:MAG: DegV family protein [Chloroflexi bacterium]|nr:DegV family protein [Chloroflexota bacterium]